MNKQIGLSFNYSSENLNDGVFRHSPRCMENRIRDAFARFNVDVHTIDLVDPESPDTIAIIYFDYNWRHWLSDKCLKTIPFEKRVYVHIEPANINPTAYYLPYFHNLFSKVFTYDEILLKANPKFIPHIVIPWGEFENYRENKYRHISFSEKKLLCSISMNRWSYMPQSTYRLRKRAYRWFEKEHPDDFDLFGHQWNKPVIFYECWFGCPKFKSYKGPINGSYASKIDVLAHYKFSLCFENSANRPGYISEKIRDCFCARTIPVYYGATGIEKHIPRECFINLRDFTSFNELYNYLASMTEVEHAKYIDAINRFIKSEAANYFSAENFMRILTSNILNTTTPISPKA